MKKLLVPAAVVFAALCLVTAASAKHKPPPPPPPPPTAYARFDAVVVNQPKPGYVEFGFTFGGFPPGESPLITVACDNGYIDSSYIDAPFATGAPTNCTATLSTVENGQTVILASTSFAVPQVG